MGEPINHFNRLKSRSSADFVNDHNPDFKIYSSNAYRQKSHDWNNYQKLAKINALEFKILYPYEPLSYHQKNEKTHHTAQRKNPHRLASMKNRIYNPALPTLRKIDRDDIMCKLSDEHSRHTTFLLKDDFDDESKYLNIPQTRFSYDLNPEEIFLGPSNINYESRPSSANFSWCTRAPRNVIDLNLGDDIKVKRQRSFEGLDVFDGIRNLYSDYKHKAKLNII